MKFVFCLALLVVACPVMPLAQTADEIKNAEKTPQNVLTYGMSYSQQRFSPLSQINRDTVRRLVPVWSYSMNNNTGEELQPLIYDGVMYVTSQDKTVAIDALTGKEIWKTPVEYAAVYFAFGDADFYIIFDVPDNISAAALSVVANQSGFVTSKIIVLMTVDETEQAFKKAMSIHFLPPGE